MPIDYSKWVKGRVAGRRDWTEDLFSLQVEAPEVKFTPGQFGRLALPIDDQMVGRPYSFVNSPADGDAKSPRQLMVVSQVYFRQKSMLAESLGRGKAQARCTL